MNPVCVIVGGPVDGFQVYGPFPDSDSAANWAEEKFSFDSTPTPWWVVELKVVEDNQNIHA